MAEQRQCSDGAGIEVIYINGNGNDELHKYLCVCGAAAAAVEIKRIFNSNRFWLRGEI